MIISKYRGNVINFNKDKNIWVFSDNDEPINNNSHPCENCGKHSTEEGHDACLGTLKGIKNACCGHGNIEECYIQFLDSSRIIGEDANTILKILKKYK